MDFKALLPRDENGIITSKLLGFDNTLVIETYLPQHYGNAVRASLQTS